MAKIVTLTVNPAIDKSTSAETVASEIKIRCEKPEFHAGGGGVNVSRAINKLDGKSTAIYTAGGGSGAMLTSLLQAEKIDTHPVSTHERTRENLTVFEMSSTLQYRFGMPGPTLSDAEWQACIEAVFSYDPDYIVASGSLAPNMPTDFYTKLANQARLTNGENRVIIDTSGAALEACADSHVFLLKPNLRELEILSGKKFTSETHILEIARDLIRDGMAEVFVISMGASGAMMVTADEAVQMRPPVVPIQSKVGAGDSMVGGIVWALANGESLVDATRYGIASGTAAVMTPGTELCRRDDVLDIYKRIAVLPV